METKAASDAAAEAAASSWAAAADAAAKAAKAAKADMRRALHARGREMSKDQQTTVHMRYQVIGGWRNDRTDGESLALYSTRRAALAAARRGIGPRRYDWTEVYDRMARQGQPELWDVDGTVLNNRR